MPVSTRVFSGRTNFGRVGDLYGRKRVYITGWIIFTVGMGIAGFAQNIEQLIAFRFFQAIGIALAIANGNANVTVDQRLNPTEMDVRLWKVVSKDSHCCFVVVHTENVHGPFARCTGRLLCTHGQATAATE